MNRVTLEEAKGRVRYVRVHADAVRIPGPYKMAFAIEELSPGVWEAKIALDAMEKEQRRDFTKAVETQGDICKIVWTRFPEVGEPYQRETKFRCNCQPEVPSVWD